MQNTIDATVGLLQQRLGTPAPAIAVLLGSGWHPFADAVQDPVDMPYGELPSFPALAVSGHSGMLRVGTVGGGGSVQGPGQHGPGQHGPAVRVAVLGGRKHAYETGEADGMKGTIRALAGWGVKVLLQTNAAGSMDPEMRPGSLMLISDHVNQMGVSPLRGKHDERLGARFNLDDIRKGRAADPLVLAGDTIVVGRSSLKDAWRQFLQAAPVFNVFYLFRGL